MKSLRRRCFPSPCLPIPHAAPPLLYGPPLRTAAGKKNKHCTHLKFTAVGCYSLLENLILKKEGHRQPCNFSTSCLVINWKGVGSQRGVLLSHRLYIKIIINKLFVSFTLLKLYEPYSTDSQRRYINSHSSISSAISLIQYCKKIEVNFLWPNIHHLGLSVLTHLRSFRFLRSLP